MKADISEEELDIFLKEAGILTERQEVVQQVGQGEPLEKLIDEIIESAQTTSTPILPSEEDEGKVLPFLFEKERPRRFQFPLLPVFISIAFLGGIFLGTIFGFYWGKTQNADTPTISFKEVDSKVSLMLQQIQEIYDKITPSTPPEEMIEPLEAPQTLEPLV